MNGDVLMTCNKEKKSLNKKKLSVNEEKTWKES